MGFVIARVAVFCWPISRDCVIRDAHALRATLLAIEYFVQSRRKQITMSVSVVVSIRNQYHPYSNGLGKLCDDDDDDASFRMIAQSDRKDNTDWSLDCVAVCSVCVFRCAIVFVHWNMLDSYLPLNVGFDNTSYTVCVYTYQHTHTLEWCDDDDDDDDEWPSTSTRCRS